jgi:quercetin dioxygenase-like cupin family protein
MKQALRETEARLPGLIQTMDPKEPGMHRTDTIDLIYVTGGACLLMLDGAEPVAVGAGDSVVLNGQLHAWRNPQTAPCRLLTVSLGVKRA